MSNEKTSEKTVIDEVIENLIRRTAILEKLLLEKNEALLIKEQQTQVLMASFEDKFKSITIQAPKPDTSGITAELDGGLEKISNTLEEWPKPIKNEYWFTLFPDQVRSVALR